MKILDNVTLCIIDCKNYDNAAKSIIHSGSMCDISFKEKIFFSDIKHEKLEKHNIRYENIYKLNNNREYDNFILKELYKHIETDFMLIIQHDGTIYKPNSWTDDFLKFDYIGAPWTNPPKYKNCVGNGGFSLRSKKFMETAASILDFSYCEEPEDVYLCETLYDQMTFHGFRYSDIFLASNFSTEAITKHTNINSFGIHVPPVNYLHMHNNFIIDMRLNIEKSW